MFESIYQYTINIDLHKQSIITYKKLKMENENQIEELVEQKAKSILGNNKLPMIDDHKLQLIDPFAKLSFLTLNNKNKTKQKCIFIFLDVDDLPRN